MSRILRSALLCVSLVVIAAAVYSCSTLGLDSGKNANVAASNSGNSFSTTLVAGDGAGNGAGNGTTVGTIDFTDDGTNLTISVDMDDANSWSASMLHIYVGEGVPTNPSNGKPTVAPGQFPYRSSDFGTWDVTGDQWTGSIDISGFTYDANNPLWIAVHGDAVQDLGSLGLQEVACQGVVGEYGLYAGNNDDRVGTVTLSIVGANLEVTIVMDAPYVMEEAQMFLALGQVVPPFSAGSWKPPLVPLGQIAENLNGATQYTFTTPLSALGIVPPDPFSELITLAIHVSLTDAGGGNSQSATAWGGDGCRTHFIKNGDPHWKSYMDCITLECPEGWLPPADTGDTREETMWAANSNNGFYEGWFPNNGFNRWGWFIYYLPGL